MPGWSAAFPRPRGGAGSVLSLPSLHTGGRFAAIRFLILWAIRSRIGFGLYIDLLLAIGDFVFSDNLALVVFLFVVGDSI
jgi:hypothetical protein